MKLEGTPKPQGTEARRFSAAKAALKSASKDAAQADPKSAQAGKSFGDILRKAAATPPANGEAPGARHADSPGVSQTAPAAAESLHAGKPAGKAVPAGEAGGDSFESHMDLVKLRLKAGYYNGSNIDEALSDRLTGYFDELG